MGNPMKYIKDLEAAGFDRTQAEAQIQVVFDMIQGEVVMKSDFEIHKAHIDRRFDQIDHRFNVIDLRFHEVESRLVNKLGFIVVSTTTIAVAILAWLIKV